MIFVVRDIGLKPVTFQKILGSSQILRPSLVGGNAAVFGLDSKTIEAGTCASYFSETCLSDTMDT